MECVGQFSMIPIPAGWCGGLTLDPIRAKVATKSPPLSPPRLCSQWCLCLRSWCVVGFPCRSPLDLRLIGSAPSCTASRPPVRSTGCHPKRELFTTYLQDQAGGL